MTGLRSPNFQVILTGPKRNDRLQLSLKAVVTTTSALAHFCLSASTSKVIGLLPAQLFQLRFPRRGLVQLSSAAASSANFLVNMNAWIAIAVDGAGSTTCASWWSFICLTIKCTTKRTTKCRTKRTTKRRQIDDKKINTF